MGQTGSWTPGASAGPGVPPASPPPAPAKNNKKKMILMAVVLLLLLSFPVIYFGAQSIQDTRNRAAEGPYSTTSCAGPLSATACKTQSVNYCVPGTCKCTRTTADNCSCVPVLGCGLTSNSPTPTQGGGGQCAGVLQPCDSVSKPCCSGQNLYCQTPTGGGQAVCQQDDGSGANCGPGGSCTGILAFRCSQLDGSGRCEQNPSNVSSWQAGLDYANGCGQVDKVCVGGTRPNTLCGDFTIVSNSCGGGGGNSPTPTKPAGSTNTPTNTPTRTPTPTQNPQCGATCTSNTQCPQNHTCSAGKCVLTACLQEGVSCSADKCTLTPTVTVTYTPTPTTITGQCQNIKVYKNGQVVNPNSLLPGDSIVLAVVGTNATKARIRVNGGTFTETSTKNDAGEYILNFTIPSSGTTTFTIEAELFIGETWR